MSTAKLADNAHGCSMRGGHSARFDGCCHSKSLTFLPPARRSGHRAAGERAKFSVNWPEAAAASRDVAIMPLSRADIFVSASPIQGRGNKILFGRATKGAWGKVLSGIHETLVVFC